MLRTLRLRRVGNCRVGVAAALGWEEINDTSARMSSARGGRILVTGALGQVGRDFVAKLRSTFGFDAVIATDVKQITAQEYLSGGDAEYGIEQLGLGSTYLQLDVTDRSAIRDMVKTFKVNRIVHLATVLSAVGERNPMLAHEVNVDGTLNVMEVARELKQTFTSSYYVKTDATDISVFAPSTIAVFGPSTPRDDVPDDVVCMPTTMYGISKVHLECLGNYYSERYGIDFRSLRYPGVISATEPGGGTTDYTIEMYKDAAKYQKCTSFVSADTALPFMHMEDCLRASVELIQADRKDLNRNVYNVTAASFTPQDVFESIKKFVPDCQMNYAVDYRNEIAQSWPNSVNDTNARNDWGWMHAYGLDEITQYMLANFERTNSANM